MRRRALLLSALVSVALLWCSGVQAQDEIQTFRRGDVNADFTHNLTDVFEFLNYVFLDGSPAVDCDQAYDFNGDFSLGVPDAIYILNWMFLSGSELPDPVDDCGFPSQDDTLTCDSYPGCPVEEPGLTPEELEEYALNAHVLRRAAYGQTPQLFDDILELENGIDDWIAEQLDPNSITENPDLDDVLDSLSYETNLNDLWDMIWARGVMSNKQLVEVLTDFWDNHFNTRYFVIRNYMNSLMTAGLVDVYTTGEANALATTFEHIENQGFRDNALGMFEDLLLVSATNVNMTVYLDSIINTVGFTNENYSREIMELHTMGVDNGYTQQDIEELSKVFTGWSICLVDSDDITGDRAADAVDLTCQTLTEDPAGDGNEWIFHFEDSAHDTTEKVIFPGTSYEITLEDDGINEGLDFITHLVGLSQTREYVCTKLVQKFVNDDVSDVALQGLIADMMVAWDDTGGDISEVMDTLLTSSEFQDDYRMTKVQTPQEYVLSTIRSFGGSVADDDTDWGFEIRGTLAQLGHLPFYWSTPDGFPESGADQLGTNLVLQRFNFNKYIHLDDGDDLDFDPVQIHDDHDVDGEDAEEITLFWINRVFGGVYSQTDLDLATQFLTTNTNGDPSPLNDAANLYDDRILQYLVYLASWPQNLQQ